MAQWSEGPSEVSTGCLRGWLRKRGLEEPARDFMQPKHLLWAPLLRPRAWAVWMLLILPINELAETTLFSNSGNPNRQIFVLQLCSLPLDVWAWKTLEGKLFSCVFSLRCVCLPQQQQSKRSDISNQACQSYECWWSSCFTEILRTPSFLWSQSLSFKSPWWVW